jgi:hypothetical protein
MRVPSRLVESAAFRPSSELVLPLEAQNLAFLHKIKFKPDEVSSPYLLERFQQWCFNVYQDKKGGSEKSPSPIFLI